MLLAAAPARAADAKLYPGQMFVFGIGNCYVEVTAGNYLGTAYLNMYGRYDTCTFAGRVTGYNAQTGYKQADTPIRTSKGWAQANTGTWYSILCIHVTAYGTGPGAVSQERCI
jgi:hypothetical protein